MVSQSLDMWVRGQDAYLSTTCTIPLATKTSGVTNLALLTKTEPLETVMVRFMPLMVVSIVPFMRVEL